MPTLTTRTLTIAVGTLLILVALLADVVGLGREPSFGWKQGVVLVIGLALVAGGALWGRVSR